jgi:hypothetical protein
MRNRPVRGKKLSCFSFRAQRRVTPGENHAAPAGNRAADRAFAFAASSSRFFGVAVVSSESSRRLEMWAISSIAESNAASLALEGLLNPVILRTNCREAARTSASVTGGSKLKRVLMFRHIFVHLPRTLAHSLGESQRGAEVRNYFFSTARRCRT